MTLFNEASFRATHNSYSGKERGSILAQLDSGIRCVELDIHDKGFGAVGGSGSAT